MKYMSLISKNRKIYITSYFKIKILFIVLCVYFFLTASSLFLYNCARYSNFLFALDFPFFKSADLTTTPVATLNQEIECYSGITISISSVRKYSNFIAITASGRNNTDTLLTFSNSQFDLNKQDTSQPYDQVYLAPSFYWEYDALPNSDFTFTQFYTVSNADCSFTLSLYGADKKKASQFMLLSSDISYNNLIDS